jgi:CheY-like chemotaxis protein
VRILVAEHDASSRLILRKTLERIGHECVAARDGIEAWELFAAEAPDVLIADRLLPGLDGPELVTRVGAAPGRCFVVMLTAGSVDEDGPAGRSAAADRYLTKPLDTAQLRLVLLDAERATAGHRGGDPNLRRLGAEASTSPTSEPLDLTILDALAEELEGTTLLASTIEGFLARTPVRLAELRTAFERDDVDLMDRAAHSLRGGAATLGAGGVAALCADLEHAARAGRLSDAGPLLAQLERVFAETEPLLRARS